MTYRKNSYSKHFRNAVLWVTGNGLFGLAPLLFLQIINGMSEEQICSKEIEQLIQDAVILFVACAITGSIAVDFILSKFKVSGWFPFFAIYISPFCMLAYLFLKYLLLYVRYDDQHEFGPGSLSVLLIAGFSIVYSILVKTIYNIRQEDARR